MPEKQASAPPCKKLRLREGEEAGIRTVRYSDLDGNGHLYNAVYSDIAVDALPDPLRRKQLRQFQINFNHEAMLDEEIHLLRAIEENTATVKGVVGDRDCFICTLEYQD